MARTKDKVATDGGQALASNPFAGLQLEALPAAPAASGSAGKSVASVTASRSPVCRRLVMRRLKAGKGGKVVTEVAGLEADPAVAHELLKRLQRQLGTGGTLKQGVIELQGDCRDTLRPLLQQDGFRVAG